MPELNAIKNHKPELNVIKNHTPELNAIKNHTPELNVHEDVIRGFLFERYL